MRGIIVAVSPEGVIGVAGEIPWHHPADLRRFKRITLGATIVMGRRTWLSLRARPLPGRRNIVITSQPIEGQETFPSLREALVTCEGDVWFIGGARLYEEAMAYADLIDVTYVPERVSDPRAVFFPRIDLAEFEPGPRGPLPEDPRLEHQVFRRRPNESGG